MEFVSIVSSFVSVIIGFFAIWLSVTFYKLSNKISEDTREAAKGISASVDRLETLFDRLYADTFTMMKDTVSDMRRHIWPEKETDGNSITKIEEKADQKIDELRKQIANELSNVMKQIGQTDAKISGVESRLTNLIDKAIQQTRQVELEAQEEISMSGLLNELISLIQNHGEITVRRLLVNPQLRYRFPRSLILDALKILERNDIITINGDLTKFDTQVMFKLGTFPKPDKTK